VLIKYLDVRDCLSVQVHPHDLRARDLVGEAFGKTEAWVVLAAAPDSRVFAGLKAGVSRRDLMNALAHGRVADWLHSFTPRAGDCVFLPAGTVHAAGGGIVLAEVQ
jgi:mannose-6-phosphate isomerase